MNTDMIAKLLNEIWLVLTQMGPYLLFGFLVAGILSVYIKAEWVEKHLGGKGILPAVKASIFGVPLPLCSCGVIPVSTGIYRHGASRSATTSFLLSTPQTGVDSVLVTYALLGPVYAIFRPVIALLTGIVGGAIVQFFDDSTQTSAAVITEDVKDDDCDCGGCSTKNSESKLTRVFKYGFIDLPKDIGLTLLVGILIAGAMAAIVPPDYLGGLIGGGIISILILMAAGVPVYVCATASVPIAAGFIHMGASPGAALAFLVAGPATNAAAFTTIFKVLGRKTAIIYLSTVAVSAVASGLLLNWLVPTLSAVIPSMADHVHGEAGLGWFENSMGVILIAVVAWSYYYKPQQLDSENEKMNQQINILNVRGMTCSHCSANVKRTAEEIAGVKTATVDLERGMVTLSGEKFDTDEVISAINSIGYTATK